MEAVVLIYLGLLIWVIVICVQKGKPGMAWLGLLWGGTIIIGAIRIAKPDSTWAKKNYPPGSVKWQLARDRFPQSIPPYAPSPPIPGLPPSQQAPPPPTRTASTPPDYAAHPDTGPPSEFRKSRQRGWVLVIALLAIVVVALAAFATFALTDDDDGGRYSSQIRDSYLEGCETEQNSEFCECTLDEIEKRFSEEEFIRFAIETTEEPPEGFIQAAFACLSEADLGG